jgi:PDZ domain-containing protein
MVILVLVVIIGAVVVALTKWETNEYAITPGNATPVEGLVHITRLPTTSRHDTIMLTDVYLQQLTAWQYLTMHFQSHVQFVNGNELLEPGIPNAELAPQGFLEMSDSKQDAEVSAFDALGWHLRATPSGSLVTGVENPSPAWSAKIHVADEIVGFDGRAVTSTCQVVGDVHPLSPGTKVTLELRRAHFSKIGVISWSSPTMVHLTTTKTPRGVSSSGCTNVKGSSPSWLGVSLEDGFAYQFPARVSIDTANIGGPSAGLAMTLCIIDELSRGSLTGHHNVAATGAIDQFGDVGDVGGVAEKTVAVQRAGAQYFIVPQIEVATAKANAAPGLHIIGVTSLEQALRALRRIGGAKPVPLTAPD